MQPRTVVPAWDPSGGRDRRIASSRLAWATGDPASKQQNILAFRYNATMEPAVCMYLEEISFHLTKYPLLVTIMSTVRVLESVVPIQHVASEGRPRSLSSKVSSFPMLILQSCCYLLLMGHPSQKVNFTMSLTLVLSCSQVLASMQFGPESGEIKHAISLSASEVTSSHFRFKYLSTSTLPPGFRCVVIPHP